MTDNGGHFESLAAEAISPGPVESGLLSLEVSQTAKVVAKHILSPKLADIS